VPAARVRRLVPGRWPDRRAPVALRGDTRISRGFILFIHPAAAGARLLARLAWTSCIEGRHTNLTWPYPFHSSSFLLRDHFDPGPVESHRMMPYSRDGDAVDACTGVDACLSGLGHMDLRGPSCTSGPKIVTTQIYGVCRVSDYFDTHRAGNNRRSGNRRRDRSPVTPPAEPMCPPEGPPHMYINKGMNE
jgi:hypothetical protein